MYKDSVNESFKYVWLSSSSKLKGQSDMSKFEKARNLKKCVSKIRKIYEEELRSKDEDIRQRATALYVIDHLALRVGNEKGEDEADTVGCCSLRVEHVKLKEPNIVEFDFLGKDSMRYQNAVEVTDIIFKNFSRFMKHKKAKDEIFDRLTTQNLNKHLKEQMEGLTAKVFRTYNASITLEKELLKMENATDMTVDEKMLFYNRANREVAILCNHQRTVSKSFGEQMNKLDAEIESMQKEKNLLEDAIIAIKKGKAIVQPESDDEGEGGEKKEEEKNSR